MLKKSISVLNKGMLAGWLVHKQFACFLSHYKYEAAAEARVLKIELVRALRTKDEQIFIDADNLTDLRHLLDHVRDSDALFLLYTGGVLSRPWCLLELDAAITHRVPIIAIAVHNSFSSDVGAIGLILDDLAAYLKNPELITPGVKRVVDCEKTLHDNGVEDIAALGLRIKDAMSNPPKVGHSNSSSESTEVDKEKGEKKDAVKIVQFDPHQSGQILQGQIKSMAAALIRTACPQNATLLIDFERSTTTPWPVNKKYAVYIIHEEKSDLAYQKAIQIRDWLLFHTNDLEPHQIVVQQERQGGVDRALIDAKPADLEEIIEDTDAVLLIQTKSVMAQPRSLSRLYAAATSNIPIIPVVLDTTGAHQEVAASMQHVFDGATGRLERLKQNVHHVAALAIKEATGTDVSEVGIVLSKIIPAIISKPIGLNIDVDELDTQMGEIERVLRAGSAAAVQAQTEPEPNPEGGEERNP